MPKALVIAVGETVQGGIALPFDNRMRLFYRKGLKCLEERPCEDGIHLVQRQPGISALERVSASLRERQIALIAEGFTPSTSDFAVR